MSRAWLWGGVVAALILAGWLIGLRTADEPEAPIRAEAPASPSLPEVTGSLPESTALVENSRPVRRANSVPPAENDLNPLEQAMLDSIERTLEELTAREDDFDPAVTQALQAARDRPEAEQVEALAQGDLATAEILRQLLAFCDRIPGSQFDVNHINEFGAGIKFSAMLVYPERISPHRKDPRTFDPPERQQEQLRELEAEIERCQWAWSLRNGGFREQLDVMARSGNVAARYLFALWPPNGLDQPFSFATWAGWHETAREYTRLNLEAGEEAGYLAFRLTYDEGVFTPKDRLLETAFALAHETCGFPLNFAFNAHLGLIRLREYKGQEGLQHLEEAQRIAEGLAAYCPP